MENFYMFREVYTWKNPNGDEKLKVKDISARKNRDESTSA